MPTGSREVVLGVDTFEVVDPGHYVMAEFLEACAEGKDSETLEGFRLITNFVEGCLPADDVERFRAAARRERVSGEWLVTAVLEAIAARPTSRPSGSSGGSPTTSTRSPAGSSSEVLERLEQQGRADLATVVLERLEQQGRADLATVVLLRQQALEASSAA